MDMPTLLPDWKVSINDGDDTGILIYCDCLDESDESRDHELSSILRQWINTKTIIRTFSTGELLPNIVSALDMIIHNWNKNYAQESPNQLEEKRNLCYFNGRLGDAYTTIDITPEYLSQRPNILSAQPIRHMILRASRAERAQLFDVFSNWRLQKLWHLDVQYYAWFRQESNIVDVIKMMKPMFSLKSIAFRGIRDTNFKVSSTLLSSKKLAKGCTVQIGTKRYVA
jgi:hypothetical protein